MVHSSAVDTIDAPLSRPATSADPQVVSFTIVTPTLNAVRFLHQCIESVQQQAGPYVTVKHAILDGGSTDGTLDLASRHPVTFLPRTPEMGLVDAMCMGFESADSDLVSFLGADDLLLPGALAVVADTYLRQRRDLIFCRTRWADEYLNSLGELAPIPTWFTASAHACLNWCYMAASATFVTPTLYRELSGFDRTFAKSEDYEFFTRLLAKKVPFSQINKTVSIYRRHQNNDSVHQDEDYWNDFRLVQEKYAPTNLIHLWILRGMVKSWVYGRNP
ncbi:MAG: glycosyltransferase, partial [Planctomycetota bacterium]|nr:glycosyltransferase [Planctomycetota bacterium]